MGNRKQDYAFNRYGVAKKYAKVRGTSAVEEFGRDKRKPITEKSMRETFQVFYTDAIEQAATNRPHPFFAFVRKAEKL